MLLLTWTFVFFFCKGALFQGKGGPPVLERLRSSLGLDRVTLNDLGYSRDVEPNSGAWTSSWPVSIFPSQGAATWWRSPTPDGNLTYGAQDWFEKSSPGRQRIKWNAPSPGIWTPPHGLTSTAHRFEDVLEQSDVEAQAVNTP